MDGVLTGCLVTADSPNDMKVTVAAGTALFGATVTAITSRNPTITAANGSNPRFDLVSLHSDNTVVVTAGTAAENPAVPALPAGNIAVGAVYVPAGATSIGDHNVGDRRTFVQGVVSTPQQVGLAPQAAPAALTDSTLGTPGATLIALRTDTTAHLAADVATCLASLNAQYNALVTALKATNLVT